MNIANQRQGFRACLVLTRGGQNILTAYEPGGRFFSRRPVKTTTYRNRPSTAAVAKAAYAIVLVRDFGKIDNVKKEHRAC